MLIARYVDIEISGGAGYISHGRAQEHLHLVTNCNALDVLQIEHSRRCPYCNTHLLKCRNEPAGLTLIPEIDSGPLETTLEKDGYQRNDYVAICTSCGFFIGRGTRDSGWGPYMDRTIRSVAEKFSIDSVDLPVEEAIRFLSKKQHYLTSLNPFKAEEFVCTLLSDYFECEVRHVGVTKDRGIDGFIMRGNDLKTILQVKWHADSKRAESVSVVKELAGTLLEHGIPRGMLVTNRSYLSLQAKDTIDRIEHSSILQAEPIRIEYKVYKDILSMLELSSHKLGRFEYPPIEFLEQITPDEGIFGGWDPRKRRKSAKRN